VGAAATKPGDLACEANPRGGGHSSSGSTFGRPSAAATRNDVERRLAERGKTSDLAEMDGLWDEAKAAERS
jgi:hypothetical protein